MGEKRCVNCWRCHLETVGSFIGLESSVCRLDGHRIFRPHTEGRFCNDHREREAKNVKNLYRVRQEVERR